MGRVGAWVLAALLAAGAIALFVWATLRRDKKGAALAAADAVDAWSQPRIDAAHARVEQLTTDFGRESLQAAAAAARVAELRAELGAKYQALELTPEEMERRFRDLRV